MEIALLVALVFVVIAVVFRRGSELFLVSVRDGRILVVRGAVPIRLRQELADLVSRPPVRRATLRARLDRSSVQLEVSGVDEGRAQRLRNVFHTFPLARLRSAPRDPNRNLGQILGIVPLAWLLDR